MVVAANQPYFLPYLAYWQLMGMADLFLVGDDYAYIRHGWIARNRILAPGGWRYFGIEVSEASPFRLCCDLRICPIDVRAKLRTLYMTYRRAPYFEAGYALAEETLTFGDDRLCEFLLHSMGCVASYLGIGTPIMRTSQFEGNALLRREERIYDFCHRLGADTYVNPIGGRSIYDQVAFRGEGIELRFLRMGEVRYNQLGAPFVAGLSILDAIMFNSREALRQMLGCYELV